VRVHGIAPITWSARWDVSNFDPRGEEMITIAIVVVALIVGAIVGAIALVRAGIAREESESSLRHEPPTRASAVTRRMVGHYVRTPKSHSADDAAEMAAVRPLHAARSGR
jgi:uncharacterized protein YneF (UPF0154 family)